MTARARKDAAALALQELRHIAGGMAGIDVECYRRHHRDPAEPMVGLGEAHARWCFFGRDPGEEEVRLQRPFVGAAGRKIRDVMQQCGVDERDVFWMNTVPFKPVGNKAWSMAVRRLCRPAMLQLLAGWNGTQVIAFGEAAFKWFGLGSTETRRQLDAFWNHPERFTSSTEVTLTVAKVERRFTLCPVPHPSGANAAWAKAFPELLRTRLSGAGRTAAGRRGGRTPG